MIIYSALYPSFAHLNLLENVDCWETVYLPQHLTRQDAILILHGGADISPGLYGETPNKYVHEGQTPSHRDRLELALAQKAIEMKIPIFGICRGAQLLCVLNGGKLIQHVNNHLSEHRLTTFDGWTLRTNSAHHQMMLPGNTPHELLAWTNKQVATKFLGEHEQPIQVEREPEIIYFPKFNSLGIQGHPEWLTPQNALVQYSLKLLTTKVLSNVDIRP